MDSTIMSGNIPLNYQSSPIAYNGGWFDSADGSGAFRGFLADWINKGAIAKEDWLRSEQSANNALYRDIVVQQYANQFNAEEAQKQREFEASLANTSFQRAVEDMKKSGINPIMLMGNGGADTPQGVSASASSSRSRGSSYRGGAADTDGAVSGLIGGIFQLVAGLITRNTKLAVAGMHSAAKNLDTTEMVTDRNGRTVYSKTKYYHK